MSSTAASSTSSQAGEVQKQSPPSNETIACQWEHCSFTAPGPEQLYDHVCEQHIGRKSTNNLNLQCMWGTCRIHVVKRDHITSHIRVHVPLKPHRCEFCSKAFKRPQDLKKHVKTHADDPVVNRPTGYANGLNGVPNGHSNGTYLSGGQHKAAYYGDNRSMHTGIPAGYGQSSYGPHAGSGFYGPTAPQPATTYGNVSYVSNNGGFENSSYDDNLKRGMQTIRDLFPQFRDGLFNPREYGQVQQRLGSIQHFQPAYNSQGPQNHAMDVGGSHASAFNSTPEYTLPPLDELRTKDDLEQLDHVMHLMQTTMYENNPSQAPAYHTQSNARPHLSIGNRHHSPVGAHLQPSQPYMATTPSVNSEGTPALTPPSSAVSNTSGNSPPALHLSPGPLYPQMHTSESSSSGYGMAPTSTMGSYYEYDDRRRYSGGRLQRAQPADASEDAMDTSDDGATTPKQSPLSKPAVSVIDPAINDVAGSPESSGEMSEDFIDENKRWLANIRTVEGIRGLIQNRLKKLELEGPAAEKDISTVGEAKKEDGDVQYPVLKADEE